MSVHKIGNAFYANDDSHPIYEVDAAYIEQNVVFLVVESKDLDLDSNFD